MRTDEQIRSDVVSELQWDPSVRDEHVAVAVDRGVVTLGGSVDSFAARTAAIVAAERVAGVRAVADDLSVVIPTSHSRSDSEIAHQALQALKWHVQVPDDRLTLRVENGLVTLTGKVRWDFQRRAAYNAIHHLTGVRAVINQIQLETSASPKDVQQRIRTALHRQAELEAASISVEVADGAVDLRGHVHSAWGRREAEHAAWNAPGVRHVNDHLQVQP
ncbi:MAG: hypothetical protein RLZZ621_1688 [Gemmatimonadota bacterium]